VRAAALLIFAGCGFEVAGVFDARIDGTEIDVPDGAADLDASITWSVDEASGKAVPASAAEWRDLIVTHGLAIAPPDGLWSMQDASGAVRDSIGAVDLMASGSVKYLEPVAGWTRRAIRSDDGSGAVLSNTVAPTLPNVGMTSLTILIVYQTAGAPPSSRSVLFGGAGVPATLGQLNVDPASHLVFTAGGATATGTVSYGTDVVAAVMRLDHDAREHHLVTNREVIAPVYTALGQSRGLFLGAASLAAPSGRWLYMAAWYGANGSISDAELQRMLVALGW
jgi:hypothetical protein